MSIVLFSFCSNTDLEKQELKVLPAAPSSGQYPPSVSSGEDQDGTPPIKDDENADVGYITQLDKDGNIQGYIEFTPNEYQFQSL